MDKQIAKYNSHLGIYKSVGEKMIADYLKVIDIPFDYEKPLLINDKGKSRIHYPDFYLSDYGGIIIEYFGRENDSQYAKGIDYKKEVYAKNNIDLIPVYPKTLKKDWQTYLVKSIDDILYNRYSRFRDTIHKNYLANQSRSLYRRSGTRY